MNGVTPLMASLSRWTLIIFIVGVSSFALQKSHGADTSTALWQAVLVAAPVALGALGWGGYDGHRASVGRVMDSDVRSKH